MLNNPICYNPNMKISEIGEFELINRIKKQIQQCNTPTRSTAEDIIIDIGDDAAAWKNRGSIQLATTDVMVESVHFDLNYTDWYSLGYKAIAVNLSDIASMGGIPQYALISLSIPEYTETEDITELYNGMINICNIYGVKITGGNISLSSKITINVFLTGYSTDKMVMTRDSATPGQKIAVTGYTGLSMAGMTILKNRLQVDNESLALFKKCHLQPEPRIEEGQILKKAGVKTAIDISDGLIADLKHICESSKVSAKINLQSIPLHPLLQKYFKEKALDMALNGGEDYEIIFVAPEAKINNIKNILKCPLHIIGETGILPPGEIEFTGNQGTITEIKSSGWDHFRNKQ